MTAVTAPVELGSTGAQVSPIGFGASGIGNEYGDMDEAAATDIVRYAFDRGISYYDTAAYYGRGLSERRLGAAIAPFRDQVFLATKGGRLDVELETGFDFSFEGIRQHCEDSLRRLGTDYVDLYQLHDVEFGSEEQVATEGIAVLLALQEAGKTRFVGVTGYPTALLARLAADQPIDTVLSYCRYNLMDRSMDHGLTEVVTGRGLGLINASILHMGLLTDRGPQPWHPAPPRIRAAARRAADVCAEAGVSIADLAGAFACAHPRVDVTLLGSNRRATLDRSLAACASALDEGLLAAVTDAIGDDLDLAWQSGRPEHFEPNALPQEAQ